MSNSVKEKLYLRLKFFHLFWSNFYFALQGKTKIGKHGPIWKTSKPVDLNEDVICKL